MNQAALQALEQAIRFESDGRDYYLQAAERTSDPLAKNLFIAMAEDEKDHIRRVREIYEELKDKPGWPSVESMVARQAGVLDVFEKEPDYVSSGEDDARQSLLKAAEMEKKGLKFYRERQAQASCDAEAEFFHKLVEEEVHHLQAIEKALELLG